MTDEAENTTVKRLQPLVAENWVQELAFEVALGYFTPEELRTKFDLSESHLAHIQGLPAFKKAVGDYRREIDDEGIAFRLRARKAAEDIIEELYAMAFTQTIDAKDRLKAMEMLCKYAGFETAKTEGSDGVKLQIYTNLNFGGAEKTYTIEIPKEGVQ